MNKQATLNSLTGQMASIIRKHAGADVEVTPLDDGFSVAGTPTAVAQAVQLLKQGFTHTSTDSIEEDPDFVVAFFQAA